nr:Integrase domain containing protein [Haemonchus contortus]
MKMLLSPLVSSRGGAQETQKSQYDQLNKDVEKFVADEDAGQTFDYWFKRYGPIIRDSTIPEDKKRDLILLKLDDAAYRKYADDILPSQPHEIDFNTTVRNLQKLFTSKKTLIRRRYECLRITCPPLTQDNVPFRDYANTIKRMDEEAALKEMDYTSMKTLQFVAGLQDPSLREIRLRMLRRLDTQPEDAPLTIEDLVAECENITALKVDNANMEASHDVHAGQKKKVICSKCGEPHYKTFCPLLMKQSPKKPKRIHHRHKRNKCKNVATFSAEHARTYINVDVQEHKLRFQLDTGADITLISRHTWKKLGFPALEPYATPVKTADGSPMKIDGRFHTEFSVKDRTNGEQHHGSGYCYVTESTNLLGLEWCTQLPAYKELQEKYHCRMVKDSEAIRNSLVADLMKQCTEVLDKSSTTIIASLRELRMLFARFENSNVIVSGSRTQFTSEAFQESREKQGIKHFCSPSFHPRLNGQAERLVNTVKRSLPKSKERDNSELLAEFLKSYQRTPCTTTPKQLSQAELLTLLKEKGPRKTVVERQYSLHHGAPERSYHIEDPVYIRYYRPGQQKWIPAHVKNRHGRVLYDVIVEKTH